MPASLVWNQERMTGLQEAYRALRTNVQFLAEDKRVIEITSPDPAQGKSTVTANLGAALAQIGIDCVIVDADLRRPTQHKIFGVDNSTGLSNLLSVRNPQINLKPSGFPNLWVIPSGPLPPDPTEMLHVRFAPLVERLRDLDALILIDTPPVLPVSDARLIAPHCDGVLVVVLGRHGQAGRGRDRDRAPLVRAREPARHRPQPVRPGPRGDRRLLLHQPRVRSRVMRRCAGRHPRRRVAADRPDRGGGRGPDRVRAAARASPRRRC